MAGKPTVPARVHARIRTLAKRGMDKTAIAEMVGCSLYTVRKATEPDYAEQERERHRSYGAERYKNRKDDPAYVAYQSEYKTTPKMLEQARLRMAALRARRKASGGG